MSNTDPLWKPEGQPAVVDLSRNNRHTRLDDAEFYHALKAAGIGLVIHKASQGIGHVDQQYAPRRKLARDAGLAWDAYHFLDGSAVSTQIAHFIAAAEPDRAMRLALDCEANPTGSSVAPFYANTAAAALDDKRGRQALRYSGAGYLTPQRVPLMPHFLAGPIWLAKYGPAPTAGSCRKLGIDPLDIVLWQVTGSGTVIGEGPIDRSYFIGSVAELALWPYLARFDGPRDATPRPPDAGSDVARPMTAAPPCSSPS
jgi:lysozyme